MFTGLVAGIGKVRSLTRGGNARLAVDAGALTDALRIGDSVAVNGTCLTATAISGGYVTFDVLAETLKRTNLGDLNAGDLVNLERPLRAGDEFGGHFVLGHVDTVGRIIRLERRADDVELDIAPEGDIMRYIVEKGSVAIDGISLTVARISKDTFTIALIPHTLQVTNLHTKKAGDRVNLEADILGKYVERLVRLGVGEDSRTAENTGDTLTLDRLREAGF